MSVTCDMAQARETREVSKLMFGAPGARTHAGGMVEGRRPTTSPYRSNAAAAADGTSQEPRECGSAGSDASQENVCAPPAQGGEAPAHASEMDVVQDGAEDGLHRGMHMVGDESSTLP